MNDNKAKVLILGGGFAGVEAAIFLRKKGYPVTLVSDRDYFYIYPTSIWVPTGEAKFEEICVPLKDLAEAHGFDLVIDEITRIARDNDYIVISNDRSLTAAIDPELVLPVYAYSIDQGYFYCHEL